MNKKINKLVYYIDLLLILSKKHKYKSIYIVL